MRSSYEVRLERPGGARTVVVRASSRSDACRMAAEAYPGWRFVVIGRITDALDSALWVPASVPGRGGGCR